MKKPLTIAIDGPAGAGKSTVARLLARELGYLYIDSGAMYRAVALVASRQAIPLTEADQVAALARTTPIHFIPGADGQDQRILIGDEDVSDEIRTPAVASLASVVSTIPGVRSALVARQRELGALGGVVMEGRDIGTVVFPHADFKYFLTASAGERAARRFRDMRSRGHKASTLEAVRADQDERDHRDTTRSVSPLVMAADAVVQETDGLTPEEIVACMLEAIAGSARDT